MIYESYYNLGKPLDDLPTKEYYYSKNPKKLCGKNKPRKQNYIIYFPRQ